MDLSDHITPEPVLFFSTTSLFLTTESAQLLYSPLLISRLHYCNCLHDGITLYAKSPLQIIQDAATIWYITPQSSHI